MIHEDGQYAVGYDDIHKLLDKLDKGVIDLIFFTSVVKMHSLSHADRSEIASCFRVKILSAILLLDPPKLDKYLRYAHKWGLDVEDLLWEPWLDGLTPLSWVCTEFGVKDTMYEGLDLPVKILTLLLERHESIDQVNTRDNYRTPLMYAVINGDLFLIKRLLEKLPDIDMKDRNGDTAISLALKLYGDNSPILALFGVYLYEHSIV